MSTLSNPIFPEVLSDAFPAEAEDDEFAAITHEELFEEFPPEKGDEVLAPLVLTDKEREEKDKQLNDYLAAHDSCVKWRERRERIDHYWRPKTLKIGLGVGVVTVIDSAIIFLQR